VSLSEVNTAIIKATNHDVCPPKEKHVRSKKKNKKKKKRFDKNGENKK
jgi:hypothetical protein